MDTLRAENDAGKRLAIELERLAERSENNPDKAGILMEAVEALNEGRIDPRLAIELTLYAQIDEDAGLWVESDMLNLAANTLSAPRPSLPPLPPGRRLQFQRRSR